MPEPLTSYIIDFHTECYNFANLLNTLYNQTLGLQTNLAAEGNPNSANSAGLMAATIFSLRTKFAYGTASVRYPAVVGLQWIDTNWGGGGGVTMDDIINEMLSATFVQLEKFIGIVDAYRIALWNAPFNAEFYGALARGFIKWPQY